MMEIKELLEMFEEYDIDKVVFMLNDKYKVTAYKMMEGHIRLDIKENHE